jgi:tRNA 2-selenouridine synthase
VSSVDGVPTLTAAAVLALRDPLMIDLRSPGEFAADHVPGAHNVPLLDDEERALVGLLYRRESPEAAFAEARGRVAASASRIVDSIASLAQWAAPRVDVAAIVEELSRDGIAAMDRRVAGLPCVQSPERPVVLCCWRGGLRSRSVTALVRALGLERAVAVEGGYKRCRTELLARLSSFAPPRTYVLHGLTGVGKTLVVRALERLRPAWTLDLELEAGHRSSLLGGAGLQPASQKQFENRIAQRVARGFPAGLMVVEGESRKVGDVIVPSPVWHALDKGVHLDLVTTQERRIDVLIEDYLASTESRRQLRESLVALTERIADAWADPLVPLLDAGRERELVALLLERWYDPRYRHSQQGRRFDATFDSTDPERCASELADWIARHAAGCSLDSAQP